MGKLLLAIMLAAGGVFVFQELEQINGGGGGFRSVSAPRPNTMDYAAKGGALIEVRRLQPERTPPNAPNSLRDAHRQWRESYIACVRAIESSSNGQGKAVKDALKRLQDSKHHYDTLKKREYRRYPRQSRW
ncbi:MAG: hypothetical protein QGG42_21945 [Phycisphaerae bacterium]|jgi:hypothetical protein|nr:hypothetical protein [Phycisphaerae bacterium]